MAKKEDEDSGSWWKLGLAGAAVAAVGGLVYGAVKLADHLEEEKEKEKQREKSEKLVSGHYAVRPSPRLPQYASNHYDRGDSIHESSFSPHQEASLYECSDATRGYFDPVNESESSFRSLRVTEPHQEEAVVIDGSLIHRLEEYYENYVEIPESQMERAQQAVEDIKNEYLEHIRENLSTFKVEMVDSGSTAEGLKVIDPDEFDVMLVVEIQNLPECENIKLQPGRETLPDANGFYHITFKQDYVQEMQSRRVRSSWPNLSKWKENGFLSPVKARSAFQSLSTQIFNNYDSYDVSTYTIGPAVTVEVKYQNNPPRRLSIDFVPAFKFGSEVYVAKPHPKVLETNGNCDDLYTYLWRRSYSSHEKKKIKKIEGRGCHLKCLKILKAVHVNHQPEMGMFSSYVLKTLLFHLYEEDPCWPDEELDERFVKMLMKLKACLEKRKLRNYFQTDINLLEHVPSSKCDHAVNYLRSTLDKQRWSDLLRY